MTADELLSFIFTNPKRKEDFDGLINDTNFDIPFYVITDNQAFLGQDEQIHISLSADPYKHYKLRLSSSTFGDTDRGKVLTHFCQIEFLLNILVILGEGVFENPKIYSEVKNFWLDDESVTTAKKIKYARYKKLIQKSTKNDLWLAKNIRNTLAHQYLPNLDLHSQLSATLRKQIVEKGKISLSSAIEETMNRTWVKLLDDFRKVQQPIVDYLHAALVNSGKIKV